MSTKEEHSNLTVQQEKRASWNTSFGKQRKFMVTDRNIKIIILSNTSFQQPRFADTQGKIHTIRMLYRKDINVLNVVRMNMHSLHLYPTLFFHHFNMMNFCIQMILMSTVELWIYISKTSCRLFVKKVMI